VAAAEPPARVTTAQHRAAVGRLVMLHRWMSADDRRWLLERFPELEATLAHLDRVDNRSPC